MTAKQKPLTSKQYKASEKLKASYKKACKKQGSHFQDISFTLDWKHKTAKPVLKAQKKHDRLFYAG